MECDKGNCDVHNLKEKSPTFDGGKKKWSSRQKELNKIAWFNKKLCAPDLGSGYTVQSWDANIPLRTS